MNSELMNLASDVVGNPHILINIISRRVRQLNYGGGAASQPMVGNTSMLGKADIALLEVIEGKLGWEMLTVAELPKQTRRKPR